MPAPPGATTESPTKAVTCSRNGAASGARPGTSSIASPKEPRYELQRAAFDRRLPEATARRSGRRGSRADPGCAVRRILDQRAEVAAHPDKSEADVLELIASTYGAPDKVAAAYRDTEVKEGGVANASARSCGP